MNPKINPDEHPVGTSLLIWTASQAFRNVPTEVKILAYSPKKRWVKLDFVNLTADYRIRWESLDSWVIEEVLEREESTLGKTD
jgi:hypothetical protein